MNRYKNILVALKEYCADLGMLTTDDLPVQSTIELCFNINEAIPSLLSTEKTQAFFEEEKRYPTENNILLLASHLLTLDKLENQLVTLFSDKQYEAESMRTRKGQLAEKVNILSFTAYLPGELKIDIILLLWETSFSSLRTRYPLAMLVNAYQ